jgi:hypothetical protein
MSPASRTGSEPTRFLRPVLVRRGRSHAEFFSALRDGPNPETCRGRTLCCATVRDPLSHVVSVPGPIHRPAFRDRQTMRALLQQTAPHHTGEAFVLSGSARRERKVPKSSLNPGPTMRPFTILITLLNSDGAGVESSYSSGEWTEGALSIRFHPLFTCLTGSSGCSKPVHTYTPLSV